MAMDNSNHRDRPAFTDPAPLEFQYTPDTSENLQDTAPDDDIHVLTLPPSVDTVLQDSTFIYGYRSAARRYGTAQTIAALNWVAQRYFNAFGIRLGVGDISKEGGGTISGHVSHRRGVDVDIRVPRSDGVEDGSDHRLPTYSRVRTQKLVELFRANDILPVTFIFFNDSNVAGVSHWKNHDNHLHVRFDINAIKVTAEVTG